MADFSASTERKTLDKMAQGFEFESNRDGGNVVANGLQQVIKDAWCRLTPEQKSATANASGYKTEFLKDGNGDYLAILNDTGGVIPVRCEQ